MEEKERGKTGKIEDSLLNNKKGGEGFGGEGRSLEEKHGQILLKI